MVFLRYPQVIPALFSGRLVRSSMKLYLHFNLPMDRSPGFGSTSCNYIALFRLALASAPNLKFLTSLHNVTRRSVLQKVRCRTFIVLHLLVNAGFQVLFHSPPGVLFTVPSQYYALSVTKEYLALRGGPRVFPQGFSCLVVLWIPPCRSRFRLRGFHPLWPAFPKPFCYLSRINYAVRTPGRTRPGLGSSVFARRYLRNHLLFSLPPAT